MVPWISAASLRSEILHRTLFHTLSHTEIHGKVLPCRNDTTELVIQIALEHCARDVSVVIGYNAYMRLVSYLLLGIGFLFLVGMYAVYEHETFGQYSALSGLSGGILIILGAGLFTWSKCGSQDSSAYNLAAAQRLFRLNILGMALWIWPAALLVMLFDNGENVAAWAISLLYLLVLPVSIACAIIGKRYEATDIRRAIVILKTPFYYGAFVLISFLIAGVFDAGLNNFLP